MNESNELLIELWDRIKQHIHAKERLDAADTLITVFDEYSLITDGLVDEDLDTPLMAAARSRLAGFDTDDESDDDYTEDDYE